MSKTFLRYSPKTATGFDIKTLLGRTPTKGTVGLEIECEGNKFEKNNANLAPFWEYHLDHSLRGKDNAEYVLTKPISFEEVPDAIASIWKVMDNYGTKLDVSNRTSVHVHLNCQDFYLNRLTSFMALYFIVEEVLTQWCGDHRVGNLFCLRAKDAPGLISHIKKFIRTNGQHELRDGLHYAGLNAHALTKFGSVEIRTLRGCTNPQTILEWVQILERLYTLSGEFNDPRDIVYLFSAEGPATFFDTILGSSANIVRQGVALTEEQIRDTLYEGVRTAQEICFCRDWSLYQPVTLTPDPFGRDLRKVAKKYASVMAAGGAEEAAMPSTNPAPYFAALATSAAETLATMPQANQILWAPTPPDAQEVLPSQDEVDEDHDDDYYNNEDYYDDEGDF